MLDTFMYHVFNCDSFLCSFIRNVCDVFLKHYSLMFSVNEDLVSYSIYTPYENFKLAFCIVLLFLPFFVKFIDRLLFIIGGNT